MIYVEKTSKKAYALSVWSLRQKWWEEDAIKPSLDKK
jgi:hypothetical protein